ncbi:symporter small accessory protein [Nautilia sp. PV-1]|jgi:cytochrome b subunit of formate dehydrogenase|uniref:symporter small accessory protein n=1 Tax=Nautilia sp. PV-1 TaxID=2579250 RepID=UPI0014396DB7|nr:symporter small accessory protein [Nautilia sp. PV-1]
MSHFDTGVSLAFWLTILSALLCVVYGIINWNKGDEESNEVLLAKWAEEEKEINEELL